MTDVADHFFPPVHKLPGNRISEYSEVNYWREPLPAISPVEVDSIITGDEPPTPTSETPPPTTTSSWRFSRMMAQQQKMKGRQRVRHYSTPANFGAGDSVTSEFSQSSRAEASVASGWGWTSNKGHLLPSENSIDMYLDWDSENSDGFNDLGIETNLSSNKKKKEKSSLWSMPFTMHSMFM